MHENSVIKNFIWNSVGSTIFFFCQWLASIVVVRLSGYDAAGELSLAMTVSATFYCVAVYNMRTYQVSDLKNKYKDTVYIVSREITCLISFFMCMIFVFMNGYEYKQSLSICLYMILRISEAFVDSIHGIDQKFERMDYIGISYGLRGVLNIVSFSLVLYATNNLGYAITSMLFFSIVVIVCFDCFKCKKLTKLSFSFPKSKIKELLWECFPLMLISLFMSFIPAIPKYLLERYYGTEMLGIYASIAMPAMIIQVAATYVFNPFVVRMTKNYNQKRLKEFLKDIFNCFSIVLLGIAAALMIAAIAGEAVLSLLFGNSIIEYVYLLQPIIWSSAMIAIVWFVFAILTIMRNMKGQLLGNVSALIACLLLSPVLIKKYDMQGVNFTIIISFLIQIVIMLIAVILQIRKDFLSKQ